MKFCFYMNCVSPHQLPLAHEICARVGETNFSYVYTDEMAGNRRRQGWTIEDAPWIRHGRAGDMGAGLMLETCDALLTGIRDVDLFERRAARGLKTFYTSERWFKPRFGRLRMCVPSFRRMARRMVSLIREGGVIYLPIGVWAAEDMVWLLGHRGKIEFDRNPFGAIRCAGFPIDNVRMWGYFVKAAEKVGRPSPRHDELRLLWVGRILKLKRIDTILKALARIRQRTEDNPWRVTFDVYGLGPAELELKNLTQRLGLTDVVAYHPPVPMDEIRSIMRAHDVYILASNGREGWGAVVSEALEEGLTVLGSRECGACVTMLDESWQFPSGNVGKLVDLVEKCMRYKNDGVLKGQGIAKWTAKEAARYLLEGMLG